MRKPSEFWKMGWMLGLTAILLASCGPKDECDTTKEVIAQESGPDEIPFHDILSHAKLAQGFQPNSTFTLADLSISIKQTGTPSGTIQVSIHRDDGSGQPEEDPISGGGPESVSDLSGIRSDVFSKLTVEFPDEPELASGTLYYFVIDFTGEISSENHFTLEGDQNDNPYADGELLTFDSDNEAWTALPNDDLEFTIEACEGED